MQGEEYTTPVFDAGTKKTFYKRGQACEYSLFTAGGYKTIYDYNAYNGTLYVKVGSAYTPIQWTAYQKGSSSTVYLRGERVNDPDNPSLYYSGGDEEVWVRGNLIETELHYAGKKRVVVSPASFNATTAVLGYSV